MCWNEWNNNFPIFVIFISTDPQLGQMIKFQVWIRRPDISEIFHRIFKMDPKLSGPWKILYCRGLRCFLNCFLYVWCRQLLVSRTAVQLMWKGWNGKLLNSTCVRLDTFISDYRYTKWNSGKMISSFDLGDWNIQGAFVQFWELIPAFNSKELSIASGQMHP